MATNDILKSVLSGFDNNADKFSEQDVYAQLSNITDLQSDELSAELLAFRFIECRENSSWGTYFGPIFIFTNEEGVIVEIPSIQEIKSEMMQYWERRAYEVSHPILKARYSGLVIDFSKKITNTPPSFSIKSMYGESLLAIAKNKLHSRDIDVITKIEKAKEFMYSLEDKKSYINTVIEYENSIAKDEHLGSWGISFDLLLDNGLSLPLEIEQGIIISLEERLKRLINDPWAVEIAALRLAKYYRKQNKLDDMRRVLYQIENSYNELINNGAGALQAVTWLKHIYNIYQQFNLTTDLPRIAILLKEKGKGIKSEMKTLSVPFEIPSKAFEDYINHMTTGDFTTVLHRLINQSIPNKERAEKRILEFQEMVPLQYLFNRIIVDEPGRITASIESIGNSDTNGHLIQQISQNMSFSDMFLDAVIQKIIEKFNLNAQSILDFIKETPIIEEDRLPIIEQGLEAYFQNNYLVAAHLLIPQIEQALRNLVEMSGGNILKLFRNGRFDLKTFDEILRDPIIKNVFNEDISLYFTILLTDPRGWNLRNNICHGLLPKEAFNIQIANRILHVLLCIGLVKKNK